MLTLPTKINWRDLNGKDWTTALRDQNPGQKNPEPTTCVAFGVLAVLEALLKIHYYNDPSQPLDLSEGNLWTCGHRWGDTVPRPTGECSTWRDDINVEDTDTWQSLTAMEYLKKFGVAAGVDSTWPTTCDCVAPSPNTRIKNFQVISIAGTKDDPPWMNDVKMHLVKIGPCIAEYDFPAPQIGSHCIAIVGYNDDEEKFWIKDSLHKAGHNDTYLDYGMVDSLNVRFHFIWVFKPRRNIDIDINIDPSELSLKMIKTGTTNLGNLDDVDPTVLPNLQSIYNASYDSGWLTISKASEKVLPLHLAVPPGNYDINVAISGNPAISGNLYFEAVEIGTPESENPLVITLRKLLPPQHLSLSFDATRNMIIANWNTVAECERYRFIKAYIRVLDYPDNNLLIEKRDLAITCENGNVSSEISVSEIFEGYAGKLCKVEVRYDCPGQLSEGPEPVGIALVTPYANIKRLENGINRIFMEIDFGAADGVDAQIFDGENQINLDPSDIENCVVCELGYPLMTNDDLRPRYYEGDWLIDPDIPTFHPGVRNGTTILKISASRLINGKCYNVKVRAKECHFIGPFAEQQITWQAASQDPTWFLEAPEIPNGWRPIP